MALRARNHSTWGLVTMNPQSTRYGPRSGLNLRRGVRAGSLRATEPRAREKTRGRKRKMSKCQKNTFIHSNICVCAVCAMIPVRVCWVCASLRICVLEPHIYLSFHFICFVRSSLLLLLLPYHVCIPPCLMLPSSLRCGSHGTTAVAQQVCVDHFYAYVDIAYA